MTAYKKINRVFKSSVHIPIDDRSRIVLISDCHRGDADNSDDFAQNQNVYFAALTKYFEEDFTYIEIGDGDEMWKNKNFSNITDQHSDVFWLLNKFYKNCRFIMIYGNHDMIKKKREWVQKNLTAFRDDRDDSHVPLFPNIHVHEGIILDYKNNNILLTHGHQIDLINSQWWRLGRFLVRHLWRPLELIGVKDPTSASRNQNKKISVEKKLSEWAAKEHKMLVVGHTHRPAFPNVGDTMYFNDGSVVHPRCMTAIEISGGTIALVKWSVKTRPSGVLYVGRDVLAGPNRLDEFFGFDN
ncbi:MAG: metallophosphoesterase family protein [Bacillota bacterium]|nr:metallophosphoesterase family protein [Bacillota bacterium]